MKNNISMDKGSSPEALFLDEYEKQLDKEIFNENYVFKCRDGNVIIPKSEFMKAKTQDWMIGNMINDLESGEKINEPIEIFETKNIVLSIIDTFRYGNVIIHEGVSINYFESVCDKWCVPDWILKQSNKNLSAKDFIQGKIKSIMLKKCIHCQAIFDLNKNHGNSCRRHTGKLILTEKIYKVFDCCGGTHSNPCCVGHHKCGESDFDKDLKEILKLNKLLNLVDATPKLT
jgi:hypothetical protein